MVRRLASFPNELEVDALQRQLADQLSSIEDIGEEQIRQYFTLVCDLERDKNGRVQRGVLERYFSYEPDILIAWLRKLDTSAENS